MDNKVNHFEVWMSLIKISLNSAPRADVLPRHPGNEKKTIFLDKLCFPVNKKTWEITVNKLGVFFAHPICGY